MKRAELNGVALDGTELRDAGLEALLAGLLRYGSWLASAAIGVGLALAVIDSLLGTHDLAMLPNMRIVSMGIAMFILLPVVRVVVMLVIFLRDGDFRFGAIAALVLAILVFGFVLGTYICLRQWRGNLSDTAPTNSPPASLSLTLFPESRLIARYNWAVSVCLCLIIFLGMVEGCLDRYYLQV